MADAEPREDGLYVTVEMQGSPRIDLDVGGPITFEEFAASLRRAGVNRFICHQSKGRRNASGGMDETLELEAVYVDEPKPATEIPSSWPGQR